jgi:hypothetical protein
MVIMGEDYHPSVQQIAFVDKETGECGARGRVVSERQPQRELLHARSRQRAAIQAKATVVRSVV